MHIRSLTAVGGDCQYLYTVVCLIIIYNLISILSTLGYLSLSQAQIVPMLQKIIMEKRYSSNFEELADTKVVFITYIIQYFIMCLHAKRVIFSKRAYLAGVLDVLLKCINNYFN